MAQNAYFSFAYTTGAADFPNYFTDPPAYVPENDDSYEAA
jgi:hypothetical protein